MESCGRFVRTTQTVIFEAKEENALTLLTSNISWKLIGIGCSTRVIRKAINAYANCLLVNSECVTSTLKYQKIP